MEVLTTCLQPREVSRNNTSEELLVEIDTDSKDLMHMHGSGYSLGRLHIPHQGFSLLGGASIDTCQKFRLLCKCDATSVSPFNSINQLNPFLQTPNSENSLPFAQSSPRTSRLSSSGPVPRRGGACVRTHSQRADVSAPRPPQAPPVGLNCSPAPRRTVRREPTAGAARRGAARERGVGGPSWGRGL